MKRPLFLLLLGLGACHHGTPPPAAEAPAVEPATTPAAPATNAAQEPMTLSAEEIAHLGITLAPAAAARYLDETAGFALVMPRDAVAQPLADLVAARAAARQSRAALARLQRLAGTAGADSAAVRETTERQSTADAAALDLAEAKMASALGQGSPWSAGKGGELTRALGAGRIRLLRITFPLGSFLEETPRQVRVARLDGRPGASVGTVASIWPATADSTMPGRSYFALLPKSDVEEGERLLAWATAATSRSGEVGTLIPSAAMVMSDNRYWYYRREATGAFIRTPLDISRPQPSGYFVTAGVNPVDVIVTAGASLLLARESNSTTDSDP
jgi:hypothetical protein